MNAFLWAIAGAILLLPFQCKAQITGSSNDGDGEAKVTQENNTQLATITEHHGVGDQEKTFLSSRSPQFAAAFVGNKNKEEDLTTSMMILASMGATSQPEDMVVSTEMAAEVENISRALVVQFLMQQHLDHGGILSSSPASPIPAFNVTTGNPFFNTPRRSPASTKVADRALEAIQQALAAPRSENGFFFESPKGVWILADVIISLLAILANLIFIDAIRTIKLDLRGYRHFLVNLSVTDIFTALICLANFSHQVISNSTQSLLIQKCGTNILRSLNIAGLLSNLLSLFGMSIDHYIGVFHPLRYQQIMGNARVVNCAIIMIWVVSLLSAVVDGLVLLAKYFIANDWSSRRGGLLASNHQGGTAASAATLSLLTLSSTPSTNLPASSFTIHHTFEPAIATTPATTTTMATTTTTPAVVDLFVNKSIITAADFATTNSSGNMTSSAQLLTERILSLMPLLEHDLSALETTASAPTGEATMMVVNTTVQPTSPLPSSTVTLFTTESIVSSTVRSLVSSGDYALQTDEVESFDPVEEIMNFVLPNDSSILEDFIKKIIKKDSEPHMLGWCSYHAAEKLWFELFVIGLTVIIFSILIPIYCRILRQVMLTRGAHEWSARKLILTTLLLLGAFLLCRVPFVLFEVLMVVLMRLGYMRTNGSHLRMMDINNILNTMLMFFPLLDPIIYAIRMKAVQRYLFWRYGKCCPSVLWCCCGRDNIPDSQSVKRFSTFTYAMSRGSFSGNSGYGGPSAPTMTTGGGGSTGGVTQRLLSISSSIIPTATRRPPPTSQSMPSQLLLATNSSSFDSASSRRSLLFNRFLPKPLSLFFTSSGHPINHRRGGRSRIGTSSLNNGNCCRRTSSRGSSKQSFVGEVKLNRIGVSRKTSDDPSTGSCDMFPLTQIHVEDEISDALSTMIEEPTFVESSNANFEQQVPVVAEAPHAHQLADDGLFSPISQTTDTERQVFFGEEAASNSPHQNATDFFVNKLNNYLTKATAAQEQGGASKTGSNGNLSDVFFSSSQSQLNNADGYDDDHAIVPAIDFATTTPVPIGKNDRPSSFYERLMFKMRRLKQMSHSPLTSSIFGGLSTGRTSENTNASDVMMMGTTASGAYEPDFLLDIQSIDGDCDSVTTPGDNEVPVRNGWPVEQDDTNAANNNLFVPALPLVPPSPHIFTKHCNNNSRHFGAMNHLHHCNNNNFSNNNANTTKTLSNSLILNKLALHTKKLFDLETKMLHMSLPSPFPVSPQC